MATSQQQQQQQQQQEEAPAMVEPTAAPVATAANPGASAGGTKSFLAVRREAVRANVASGGRRIVCTQAMGLVTTTVLGMLCLWAYWETESTCTGGPVGLRSWYLGAFVLECVSVMCFFCIMYSVLSVWSSQPPRARLAEGHENSDEGGHAVGLGFALACLAFFVVIWSTVGLLSERDASGCESGNGYFWYIFTVMWVSICCCTGGSATDTFRHRHPAQAAWAPAPQEITV